MIIKQKLNIFGFTVAITAALLLATTALAGHHGAEKKDKDKLVAILTYHVVPGKVSAAEVVKLDSASTVNGSDVQITVLDGNVLINDSRVVMTDIYASNGVIHVVDTVILPK